MPGFIRPIELLLFDSGRVDWMIHWAIIGNYVFLDYSRINHAVGTQVTDGVRERDILAV